TSASGLRPARVSPAGREAVAARVGTADPRVAEAEDRLPDAEAVREHGPPHLVPESAQRLLLPPQAGLELDGAVRLDAPARRVERGLRVGALVDEPQHDLEVALRLHRAAHDPERPEQAAALKQQPGDNGVERPPRGREPVRVPVLFDEAGGP